MHAEIRDRDLKVSLDGQLDGEAARWLEEFLEAFQPLRLLVDLGRVRTFDEAALGQLVAQCRRIPGIRLELDGAAPGLVGAVARLRAPAGPPAAG